MVGRGASAKGGTGVRKQESVVSNMFSADAARIYISQLTKIDRKLWNCIKVSPVEARPGAAIGIKADDDIRIDSEKQL